MGPAQEWGKTVVTTAILSILLTAPIGLLVIALLGPKMLSNRWCGAYDAIRRRRECWNKPTPSYPDEHAWNEALRNDSTRVFARRNIRDSGVRVKRARGNRNFLHASVAVHIREMDDVQSFSQSTELVRTSKASITKFKSKSKSSNTAFMPVFYLFNLSNRFFFSQFEMHAMQTLQFPLLAFFIISLRTYSLRRFFIKWFGQFVYFSRDGKKEWICRGIQSFLYHSFRFNFSFSQFQRIQFGCPYFRSICIPTLLRFSIVMEFKISFLECLILHILPLTTSGCDLVQSRYNQLEHIDI
jgi:hypothetical protein